VFVATTPLRVLIVEDSEADADFMLRALRTGGFAPAYERVDTAEAMRRALEHQPWDIVLSDYSLPAFDGPAALALLQAQRPDIPFIVVSGSVGEDTAVAVMKAGATDYIMKDRLQRLAPAVSRAVADAAVRRERQRLTQQLLESQKLEAVGRLAGGVAHDFNNVLTAILGSAELLLLSTPPNAPKQEELEIIRDAGLRAKELIRQLLAFSARQVLTPTVLDLNHLVKNVNKMLRRLIGEDIELVTALAPDPGAVRADAGQIEQVLVNLVVNARDAMPKGGRLTIATAEVDISDPNTSEHHQVPPGRYVALRVTDTGIGMDRETQGHVFEPFFTTKPRAHGTGLGLATVYGIVRQSGGHVTLDSAPGAGTTFCIYLPSVDEPVTPVSAPAAVAAPAAGTGTVLLAEDEHLVRILARKTLEQAGYHVLVAAGAPEALAIAQHHDGPIDLLLTDVVMPEMSGRDLTHRLTELRPDVRVLYMSGYSDEAVARHGVLDDGTAFIQKPFTPGELARKVREVLEGG
jgi:two-component system, cell cycle sensor histidine kinase and response regulator CckA